MPTQRGPLPRISVVVPSYNQARFLPEALDSIFRQGYPHLEVVVMDGGSDDGSVAVIESYAPRLKYWQSRPDGGQSAAINAGMKHGTGDLVAWLNSDDFYWRDALWTVGRAYAAHPGRGLYVGNGFRYEQATGEYSPYCPRHVAMNREALRLGTDFLLQPSVFMLREAWEQAGGLDVGLNFCMDWNIFMRIADRRPAVLMNEFLSVTREYEETKTRSGKMKLAFEIVRMVERQTDQGLTRGSLMYLLHTLLGVTGDAASDEVRGHLSEALYAVAREVSMRWGGGHGYPEASDEGDRVYLPFAGAAEPPSPADDPPLPSISLVLPTDGEEEGLIRTLESIARQRYPLAEAVVVDHAEAPRLSAAGPDPAGEAGPMTRLSAPGLNRAAAVNRGLAHAAGEVLAWMNPGDLPTVGALRAVGRAFAEDPELDVVYGNAVHFDGADVVYPALGLPYRDGFWIGRPPEPVGPLPPEWGCHPVAPPTVYFRRRLLERCGGLDESAPAAFRDYEFMTRLFADARVHKLERTQALCRWRPVDAADWRAGWYRAWRRRWPGLLARGYRGALRQYVAHYMHRKYPGARRGLAFWATAAAVALLAVTGLRNPERWRPAPPFLVQRPPPREEALRERIAPPEAAHRAPDVAPRAPEDVCVAFEKAA